MGRVFLARDRRLGRLVAVKVLHEGGPRASRLLTEARATARARHDNIVVIHDIGIVDGRPYMVLEYLSGQTLRAVLAKAKRGVERPLPRGMALEIVASVAQALSAAHKASVVHRDLKPENIMLLDSGQVKVLDFGLARRIDTAGHSKPVGTFAYMSPEQMAGDEVNETTDIWALGIILFEIISGAHPSMTHSGLGYSSVADLYTPMPMLRDVCPGIGRLSDVVDRCLRKRKDERYGSADELLAALEPLRTRSDVFTGGERQSPFAGLAAFQESDARRFFGRERDIATVLGWLGRQPLIAVAGASGSGKSSFVRAGVIPALKRSGETWDVLHIRPGRAPLLALSEALAPDVANADFRNEPGLFGASLRARCRDGESQRIVIFVDQFEELFTLVTDPDERATFLACLLGAADDASSPLRVILAIRSDFLERFVEDQAFLNRLQSALFFLPFVAMEGLRDALVKPVEASGYRFEDDSMIADILSDLSQTRSPLPLLQFSASALWDQRDWEHKLLTRQKYEKLGGVVGALTAHAEMVVAGLSSVDLMVCRAITLRLVTPERTRAIVTMDELLGMSADTAIVIRVVRHLCAARLLLLDTGGGSTSTRVELVHESLIERWPSLTRWLDESSGDARFLARLRVAAKQWQIEGEPSWLLWRDRAAEDACTWYERYAAAEGKNREWLGACEKRYIEAVISHHERQRKYRQRLMGGALAFVTCVAIVVFLLALQERAQARRADAEAMLVRQQNEKLAVQAIEGRNAKRMLAAHKRQDDPTLVLAILREIEPPDMPKDWSELVSGALTSGVSLTERYFAENPAYGAEVSPDGTRVALAMNNTTAYILSTDGLNDVITLRGHEGPLWNVTWSADGKRIATASGDKTARIWNADGSGKPIVLRGHTADVYAVDFSPDGERVLTGSDDGTVRMWNARDGKEMFVIPHEVEILGVQFSPDGRRFAMAAIDGIVRVMNTDRSGKPLLLRGHTDLVSRAAWSPDGTRIATASKDKTVRVWDAATGAELLILRGHEDKVMTVAWSPDGQRIASACKDKTARIWNADGSGDPFVLRGHQHWVYSAAFTPDSRHLITTSLDRMVRLWNLEAIVAPTVLRGHEDIASLMSFSPNGKQVATGSSDTTVRIWNADGTGNARVLRGHKGHVIYVAWSHDGSRIISASRDGTVRISYLDRDLEPIVITVGKDLIRHVDWSPGGERILISTIDGTLETWRSDGKKLAAGHRFAVDWNTLMASLFDPLGKNAVVFDSVHDVVHLWNVDQPDHLVALEPNSGPSEWVRWSPDGSRIVAVSTTDGAARIWNMPDSTTPIVLRERVPIVTAQWSPDGRRLAMIGRDGMVYIRSADGAGDSLAFGGRNGLLSSLAWTKDGHRVLMGFPNGTTHVWNADGSGAPFVLGGSLVRVASAVSSPDGAHIGIMTEEKVARIWPDVQPLRGPSDARLWTATSYCIPAELRVELFSVTETEARAQQETCTQRVAEANKPR